jgi:AcrR family transcriptional regulator
MTGHVKPRRSYNSPRRQQQAAATRRAILDAAEKLFDEHGYPATTMDDIATAAGVALKTVYVAFSTKSGLLRALWDLRLKGDQDEPGVAERPWYQEVLDEPNAARQLWLNARNSCVVKQRIAGVLKAIRGAASVDADAAALWRLIQADFYANQRVIVEGLDAKRALREGMDVTRATDILWTLNHPDTWLLLVGERGWTPARYEDWFADTACAQLLRR